MNNRYKGKNRFDFIAPFSNAALYRFVCVFIVLAFLVIIVSAIVIGRTSEQTSSDNVSPSDESQPEEQELPATILGGTVTMSMENSQIGYGDLILVNNNYACAYDEPQTVSLLENTKYGYSVSDYEVRIDKDVFEYADALLGDFEAQNGGSSNLNVSCAYRSKDVQTELYNNKVEADGKEEADKWIALPGYSEHQTGYAFDLSILEDGAVYDYTGTGEYEWINNNCYKYGFIVRYPVERAETTGIEYEPWHFRYVGEPHAEYIFRNNLCFEDYIEFLRTKTVSDPLIINSENGDYAVYYCEQDGSGSQTQLTVPTSYGYEISGNNVDGFIVTVNLP